MLSPLQLLAQADQQQGLLGIVDKLARTPLSQVVAFVAVCTALRLILHYTLLKPVPAYERIYISPGVDKVTRFFNELLDAIVYAGVFVFLVIRPFILQTFFIPSGSMLNTLQIRDYIVANKFVYRVSDPKAGDIIVFKPRPEVLAAQGQKGDVDYIKRIIGVPGDVVEIRDNVLYRNGKQVEEPYKTFTRAELDARAPGGYRFTDVPADEAIGTYDFKVVEYKGKVMPVLSDGFRANARDMGILSDYAIDNVQEMQLVNSLPAAKIPAGMYLVSGDNRNGSFDGRFWGFVPRKSIVARSEFIWAPVGRWRVTR